MEMACCCWNDGMGVRKMMEAARSLNVGLGFIFGLKNQIDDIPHLDDIVDLEDDEDEDEDDLQTKRKGKRPISGSSGLGPTAQGKKSKQTGPIDLYFAKDVEEIFRQRRGKNKGQYDENKKKLREDAVQKFATWMYDAGIPFNAVKYDSLQPCIDDIGTFGVGMKPPSYHEVRVKYLKSELTNTNLFLKSHEEDHAKYGCTIMSDGWTDKKSRSLINFLVNRPKGTVFIESVDASSYSQTADKMYKLLSRFVNRIGEKNVVQVVTDNASCNVKAGRLLENNFPHLYWTPCAAHCLDLMLEEIFKIPHLKQLHERALMVNDYIYNRPQLLSMMREFIRQRDMIRTAKTRFAIVFLTLKRFQVHQANLRKMFTFEKWSTSLYSKEAAGKRVAEVIMMPSFWKSAVFSLKVGGPLVKVLRLVDGEKRSPMGYIYDAMDRAKEAIAASINKNEEKYYGIFEIIDKRWNIQLHHPLHAAGYFMNPEFFYSNPDIENDDEVLEGLYKCIARLVGGEDLRDKITNQLEKYKNAEGLFGLPMAIRQRASKSPADWWSSYGASTPKLKSFAMKILYLTCSSSGCEHYLSVFEHVVSQRLNDLVYIKYNRALRRRYALRDKIDPISLSEIDDCNEWLLEKLDDSDKDNEDNDFVFEAPFELDARTRNASSSKGASSSISAKRKQSLARTRLVDEEEELNIDYETEEEEEDTDGYKSSDGADDVDLENEDDYYDI
ncbi:uncharacterized protein [Henckelia pumila]|uniref:uncharacterized protein n=1 Tax=Henckelia pumila TaxID=405737 RepID=UPI003C6E1BD2